jgi:hypothetical protein
MCRSYNKDYSHILKGVLFSAFVCCKNVANQTFLLQLLQLTVFLVGKKCKCIYIKIKKFAPHQCIRKHTYTYTYRTFLWLHVINSMLYFFFIQCMSFVFMPMFVRICLTFINVFVDNIINGSHFYMFTWTPLTGTLNQC